MFDSIKRRATRLVAMTAIVSTVATGMLAGPAEAMSPQQTTTDGLVSLLAANTTYGGLQDFWTRSFAGWGRAYAKPKLYYYGTGVWMGTVCGNVNTQTWLNNAFYCRDGSHSIYIDKNYFQSLITKYGDFRAGGILAHEWGHAMAWKLGYKITDFREEYHADCFAGMYARYGYATGRLTGNDYYEFRNWYLTLTYSGSHGYPTTRAAWFDYGYNEYKLSSCNLAYNMTAPKLAPKHMPPPTQKQGEVTDLVG